MCCVCCFSYQDHCLAIQPRAVKPIQEVRLYRVTWFCSACLLSSFLVHSLPPQPIFPQVYSDLLYRTPSQSHCYKIYEVFLSSFICRFVQARLFLKPVTPQFQGVSHSSILNWCLPPIAAAKSKVSYALHLESCRNTYNATLEDSPKGPQAKQMYFLVFVIY